MTYKYDNVLCFQQSWSDLLARKGFDAGRYCVEIGDGDEMFFKAILPGYANDIDLSRFKYIESALRSYDIYQSLATALGGFGAIGHVLDFGSGWGRLTRSLVHRLDRSQIWIADVYHDAVAWQVDRFGVNGLVSSADPDRFALPQEFSIVLAGSVFSHLPAALFNRWLARLMRLVPSNGLLAFSVHSELMLQPRMAVDPSGFNFQPWSESGSLGVDVYGMSYVTENFVARAISAGAGSRKVTYRRFQKAFYENQDLYVVAGERVDLSGLSLPITPMCGINEAVFGEDSVRMSGWAIDLNPGHQLVRAELHQGDRHLATMMPRRGNDHVSAYFPGAPNHPTDWSFALPHGLTAVDGLVRASLTSSSGSVAYGYATPPDDTGKVRHN